jgi:metal-sulfur cluster biosynthetic enzyme
MSDEPQKKINWKAEDTHPELIEPLKDALRTIVDPEIGLNVIELGLVRDVKIEEHNADVTMILTTPFCPYGPAIMETTRLKA